MLIVEKTYSDEVMAERDFFGQSLQIDINGKKAFSVTEGEPEDMTLSRDLSSCYGITELLKKAYEAGVNGESFEIIYEDLIS